MNQQPDEKESERERIVRQAGDRWIARLIDLSRRNNLLYYRPLRLGTLEVMDLAPRQITALLSEEALLVRDVLPPPPAGVEHDPAAAAEAERQGLLSLREIRRKATENLEEKGLETLHLALGLASWPAEDGGRDPEAPVLLLPIQIETRGGAGRAHAIRLAGEPEINPVLLFALEKRFALRLDADALLSGLLPDGTEGAPEEFAPAALYDRLREAARDVAGLRVEARQVIGNFSFAKMAMVKDLEAHQDELPLHDVVSALAGERSARETLAAAVREVDPRALDDVHPSAEHLVLDADASQQQVIAQVLAGQSGVVQGPPGTGKSQTITNLLAEFAARETKVLFVAEKRAALDVVRDRMERAGLGHMVLDLHGTLMTRKAVMQRVAEALDEIGRALPVDQGALHAEVTKTRERLNTHARRLHRVRQETGASVYDMQSALIGTPVEAAAEIRFAPAPPGREAAQAILSGLEDLAQFEALFLGTSSSPWTGARISTAEEAQTAIALVERLRSETRPAYDEAAADVEARLPGGLGLDITRALGRANVMSDVNALTSLYGEDFFQDPDQVAAWRRSLEPARGSLLHRAYAWLSDGAYRRARAELRARLAGERKSAPAIFADMVRAADVRGRWNAVVGTDEVRPVRGAERLRDCAATLAADLMALEETLDRDDLAQRPLEEVYVLVNRLAQDRATPYALPSLAAAERALAALGMASLLGYIRSRRLPASLWASAFRHAWYRSVLEVIWAKESDLAAFHGRSHDQTVERFREADRERTEEAALRVRRIHAERVIAVMNAFPAERDLVRAEAMKKSRHLPLRRLLERAPNVLTALFPCWMASPLSVSQVMGKGRNLFDYALFDEASQVPPEDAICTVLRARHLVVAGDRHQLPPTAFFADGAAESDEAEEDLEGLVADGFESLLDAAGSFLPSWMLEWHYRSRDETLIAFANHHVYRDRLVTFPNAATDRAISHELVPHEVGLDGQEESAAKEVSRVVELVIRHAEERPAETLGVITMGIRHAKRIQMALDQLLPLRPDLAEFFDESSEERFFVKNLERVQGDERDAIILSVGYGKDRGGNLPYRFGPILQSGGERRLNVAVTRARQRMTLVSSFSHLDMDPARSDAAGVIFLRRYLEYAASGGRRLAAEGPAPVPLNAFESDVLETLANRGIQMVPQYGCSRYRIDFAVQHPDEPGRMVLALECDGASYHSAPTARDRDRLRQQMLESLGWRFHRIWSTDWFFRKEEEVERLLAAYQRALDTASTPEPEAREAPLAESGHETLSIERGPLPITIRIGGIGAYSDRDLARIVQWVKSDGRLRTDDQIIAEVSSVLGFARKGARIVRRLSDAIRRVDDGPEPDVFAGSARTPRLR